MQNIFTEGTGNIDTGLEHYTKNTTWNPEVYIKPWFLLKKNIFKGFHWEFYVSVEKQKIFIGNFIGLLLTNFREKCVKQLSAPHLHTAHCACVWGFPSLSTRLMSWVGDWEGNTGHCRTCHHSSDSFTPKEMPLVCLASVFPSRLGYHAESPSLTVGSLANSFPSGSRHMNPNREHPSDFPSVQTQKWLHTGPGAAGFPYQPLTTMNISPHNQTPPLRGSVAFCVVVPNIPDDQEWVASFFPNRVPR